MKILVDTHVHLYPFYDQAAAFGALLANLARLHESAVLIGCLTERSDCRAFEALCDRRFDLPDFDVRTVGRREAVRFRRKADTSGPDGSGRELWLIPGRQIVSGEGVEVLALAVTAEIPDGLSVGEILIKTRQCGGIPVFCWAPGKWLFRRGKVVRHAIERHTGGRLLVGDSTLRPTLLPEPALFKKSSAAGRPVLAGSDALPVPGEEQKLGSYATLLDGEFDSARPLDSVRNLLAKAGSGTTRLGTRSGTLEVIQRLLANSKARQAGA